VPRFVGGRFPWALVASSHVSALASQPTARPSSGTAAAVDAVRRWGEARDWRGYDPYDGLSSPLAPALTLGTRTGRRVLTQVVKRCPVNLRPLLRIRPAWNSKALALVASGYARLFAARGDPQLAASAGCWLATLLLRGERGSGLAWGYSFDVQTRFFRYARETPNAIATSFAVRAFLEGHRYLGGESWLRAAERACDSLVRSLLTRDEGRAFFAYLPGERALVHNANALAASAVVATGRAAARDDLVTRGLRALATTTAAQRPDGSWAYAEDDAGRWVDNFHTAYVLQSLAECLPAQPSLAEPLERGVAFWAGELFDGDRPRYAVGRTYPLDAHCYADAVETWLRLAGRRPDAPAAAQRAAAALVRDMLAPEGYVYLQRQRRWTNRVPCIRWSTAPAFRALAGLELLEARADAGLD
jgi:hypothetical protein